MVIYWQTQQLEKNTGLTIVLIIKMPRYGKMFLNGAEG